MTALPVCGDTPPCDAIVDRVEVGGTALSRSLTSTLCRYAVEQKWLSSADADTIQSREDLRALLQKRQGRDLIGAGAQMFADFERAAGNAVGTTWRVRDTDHYRILLRPDSSAAKDIDLIAADAERSRAALVEAFKFDPILRERESLIRSKQPAGIDSPQPSNRVVVFLYPNRRDDADKHIGSRSLGSTSFGATIDDSGHGLLQPTIYILYFNSMSLSVLEHEISHALIMLAAFDSGALGKTLSGEADLKKAFLAGYRPMPAFLNEGFAGYGLYYAGFYASWGLLGSPEALAAAEDLPPLSKQLRADHLDPRQSLVAATFLRYLMAVKGAEAVRQWLLSANVAAFPTVMGMTIEDAEREWRQKLQKR